MPFFRRQTKTVGVRPSEEDVRAAAAALNAGDNGPADLLCIGSGEYRQETAMRIFRYIDVEAP
ncbi:hypothetical protein [Streptomyces sp. NPDC096033]|uniref:hypothetical protein n=1 Tax=Streptomyces sp. NPDC096033 TaxID=3366071 RepID=UPI00380DE9C2